jgi:hypothetical protein
MNIPNWLLKPLARGFTAILTRLAGFTQFSNLVLQDHRQLHTHRSRIHLDVNQYSIKAGDTVNMRRTYLDIAVNMSLLRAAVFPETIR